jgi:pilus assembly protein Flp/PilA
MLNYMTSFCYEDEGATAIEYGLIAAFVSIAAIGGFTALGNTLSQIFTSVSNEMNVTTTP